MITIVTGAAGFIGFHVVKEMLARGDEVIGVDCVNDYYDVGLKEARLSQLADNPNFKFYRYDIANKDQMLTLNKSGAECIVNLAAQAGVRYSLTNPYAYVTSNVMGQVVMLELARQLPQLKHFVYASSSSVYGGNTKTPFSVEDEVDSPISLYAATKRSDELIAKTYSHLFGIPSTGLRFFTVYGPWGRPDMAAYLFADAIMQDRPITVFNNGNMRRDFTYIDDIVDGLLKARDRAPTVRAGKTAANIYNLGNSHTVELMDFSRTLEEALGKKAHYDFQPLQAGDVPETFADISSSVAELGFCPTVDVGTGIPRFVEWYNSYCHRPGFGQRAVVSTPGLEKL